MQLALILALPTPALPPTKVVVTNAPKEKIYLMLMSKPLKPLGTHRLNRDASTQVNTFTNGIGNCFAKFHKFRGRQTRFENRNIFQTTEQNKTLEERERGKKKKKN